MQRHVSDRFWEIGECDSTHMFASQNGESRLTSAYAVTLSFHPWNKVEYCPKPVCEESKNKMKEEMSK